MATDTLQEFRLPDVGEGLTEAEIVAWRVAVGDEIAVNDVLVDIETAKSIVELPSPYAGRVAELLVAEGDTVAVGTPIVRISGPGESASGPTGEVAADEAPVDPPLDGEASADSARADRPQVLVGYGPSQRRRRSRSGRREHHRPARSVRVLAKPPVRKLAKDLGIDLATVPCDGPVVTRDDVLRHRSRLMQAEPAPASAAGSSATSVPVTGVRRATAEAMIASSSIPQATEWVTVDVTRTVELVERLRADRRFEGVKVTPTLVAARAVCLALRRTPDLHAKWRETTIEHPESVGLGIATATPRGLVVPVVRDADRLDLRGLGEAIADLVSTARAGRIQPEQLSGGTFSLTNVGVFGVDGGAPILPPDQSGILSLGQVAKRPWVVGDEVVARWVTTLAVTFDHRVADGEQASHFLADAAAILEDPALAVAF